MSDETRHDMKERESDARLCHFLETVSRTSHVSNNDAQEYDVSLGIKLTQ